MGKRKDKNSDGNIVSVLADAPWQFSVVFAGVVFALMKWVIPSLAHSPFLTPLAKMLSALAPFAAAFILLIAIASFLRNKKRPPRTTYPSHERTNTNIPTNTDSGLPTDRTTPKQSLPTEWSIELLRKLEWKRFEVLCAEYFRILGKRVETVSHGADGGIDARIYANSSNELEYAIQCKAWGNMIGIKPIRELFGVMAHESAGKGIFMATSRFTEDAIKFAAEHSNKLFLVDGEKFLSMLLKLPKDKQQKLLVHATAGDYTTPTCASCGIKMVWRTKGNFWGCSNYPKCKSTLRVAQAQAELSQYTYLYT